MDPRRIRTRPALLSVGLAATLLGGLAVGWAGLATVRERAFYLLPTRVAADVVEQVGAAMVVAGLLAALAAVGLAGLVARWFGGQLEGVRRLATGSAADTTGSPAELLEVHTLAQSVRDRVIGEAEQRQRLERERDQLAALLDGVGEGILQLDARGRVVRANPTAKAILSLPEEPEGQVFAGVVRHHELRRLLEAAVKGGSPEPAELSLNERRLLVVTQPLPPDRGDSEASRGVVMSLIDLTEIKRLESVRRDFVANASHELKTPLTSIRGYAETLLSDDPDPAVRAQFLATIRENAERLQNIVDDLLDLSRLESGGWAPDLQAVALAVVARDVWQAYEDRAGRKGVRLRVEDSAAREVSADPLALRQILTNLFDNALRHTPNGGEIRVAARSLAADVQEGSGASGSPGGDTRRPGSGRRPDPVMAIDVSDTGSGIPGEALPRIFERFYRVDPARSRAEGGTGLGLAIVKHLVESMGGTVEAESELGRGTTIRFYLPVGGGARLPGG